MTAICLSVMMVVFQFPFGKCSVFDKKITSNIMIIHYF